MRSNRVGHECEGGSGSTQSGHEHYGFVLSTNRGVEVRVEIRLLCLVCGRTSHTNSFEADFGQSTSTWSEHKPLALPEVCTKHCQREYYCQNHGLIVHCTSLTTIERFTADYSKTVVTPCGLL
jgi:hypothetical protein